MKIRIISVIVIIAIGIITVGGVLISEKSTVDQYNQFLSSARENAENEIPYVSVQKYKAALAIDCSDESVYREYIKECEILGETFYEEAVKDYTDKFPESSQAHEDLCTYYYDTENYQAVITTANKAREAGIATEKVKEYYLECAYMFKYVATGFDEASSFLGNYALVKKDEAYGYISDAGGYLIAPMYKDAAFFLGSATAVCDDEWYFVNQAGYKVAKPDKEVDSMSYLSNGKILVSKNGKYTYASSSLKIPNDFQYDAASDFKNNVAAVKKGNKWALINSQEENLTDYIYDDILLDEFDACINNGVIFAKINGKYYLIDENGNRLSDKGFDNAYPFYGTSPAAVCVDGKWGFIDSTGKEIIKPQYVDAKSFSNGLGEVCVDGKWGYINEANEFRIEAQFSDCLPFSDNGIAAVQENNVWNYIKLISYDN